VKLTPEDLITSYNNFYEWGLAKDQPKELANHGWKTRPWSVEIGGSCANPRKLDVDELIQLLGQSNAVITGIVVLRLGRW